jgi:signal transduction histidine kinase/CheY-like chemotaxis protein/HPt (histidine-containing phosphotransfer) domain-containing protein
MNRSSARFFAIFFLTLSLVRAGTSPETGKYVFQRYSIDQYNASPQNWAIAQDRRGIMYFGNTEALLEFDGQSWRSIGLPNSSIVRAVAVDTSGTVYVGGVGIFGRLKPDQTGTMQFVSLLDKIPAGDRKFSDVWRILPTVQGVYFSSYERLFRLNRDESMSIWRPISNFGRAIAIQGALYIKTREKGLLKMDSSTLTPVRGGDVFQKLGITAGASLPSGGGIIATPKNLFRLNADGVTPFSTEADSYFAANLVYTLDVFPDEEIAAGTQKGGIVLLSGGGGLDRILTHADGLSDDYIAAIFHDKQSGLWFASNSGITYLNPAVSRFGADLGLQGDVRFVIRGKEGIYSGTTAGLFAIKTAVGAEPRFEHVPGIDTAVNRVLPRQDQLLVATDTGVFAVESGHSRSIFTTQPEVMNDIVPSLRDPSIVYAVGRAGVFVLQQQAKSWTKTAAFAAPSQEFRSAREDPDGRVWATTNGAIWRLDFRGQTVQSESFSDAQGAPVGLKNPRLFHGHMIFATPRGVRRWAESNRRFEPDPEFGNEYADGSRDVFDIYEEPPGNVWITGKGYHDLLLHNETGYTARHEPLYGSDIREIYQMTFDPDGTAWAFGGKGVLYRWQKSLYSNPDQDFQVLVRRVGTTADNSTIYNGGGGFAATRLLWRQNALRFEFAAPFSEAPGAVEYQVLLEGSDRDWLPWTHEPLKEYTHLSEGSYTFHVRARTPHGATAEQASIAFGVLPPWYRTWWAYLSYCLLGLSGGWGLIRLRTQHLENEERRLKVIIRENTAEISRQRDEIQQKEQRTHTMMLTVSHEIRTPLNSIIGMSDVLSGTRLTPDQRKYVEVFQRNGLNLLTLINDLLDLAKVESGHIDLEFIPFDLREVIDRAIEVVEKRAADRGLYVRRAIVQDIPLLLIGDPNRLRQILINLMGNSIKFTEQGGIEVHVEPDTEAPQSGRLRFAIVDTGIGIPADKTSRIFESFSQVDSSTTRKYGGTGLGLTISKQLAEAMKGRMWVESTLGHGSTFFFTAEFALQENQSESMVEPVSQVIALDTGTVRRGIRILLVDDSEDNRFLIHSYLNGADCITDVAEDGAQAVKIFVPARYDVILMDVEMPVMDGYAATREIRRVEESSAAQPTPILALTAHAFADMAAKVLASGFTDVLTKPIRKNTLIEALARHCPNRGEDSAIDSTPPARIRVTVEEGMEEAVPAYLEKRRRDLPLYQAALAANDFDSIKSMSHKMKGTGESYGFPQLTEIAGVLEQAAGRGDAFEIEKKLIDLANFMGSVELQNDAR